MLGTDFTLAIGRRSNSPLTSKFAQKVCRECLVRLTGDPKIALKGGQSRLVFSIQRGFALMFAWGALSLVLQDLGLYEDARSFCEWLEPAEWFDTRGPFATAEWLGVDRSLVNRLNSPVDITLLRRFAQKRELGPGDPIWEVMRMVGEDLFMYLRTLRERLDYVAEKATFLDVGEGDDSVRILFMPRTDPMPDDPSSSLGRYIESVGEKVDGLIYPDRRGEGYGLSRHDDSALLDFTQIVDEVDVHFAHARGFVAKTSATSLERLTELVEQARV